MHYVELKSLVCSIYENYPCRASQGLQVEKWCYAFSELFRSADISHLSFFLDVLLDEQCWEETDTIHLIKLNRRIVAKKIVEKKSWKNTTNPLNDFDLLKLACCCCLEDDILILFEHFKQKFKVSNDIVKRKIFVDFLSSRATLSDPMTKYWLYIVSGYASPRRLEGKNIYEYGLNLALNMKENYVEAVEFFWNKLKLVPEDQLSTQQKHEIFINTAVRASHCWKYPEIFEFCIAEISPDSYKEILKRDFEENGFFHSSLGTLTDMCRFDLIQKLFDSFEPNDISEDTYSQWLTFLEIEDYSEHYASEAVKLFMHIWMKEGFDRHRALVLSETDDDSGEADNFLVRFVKGNYMEPVWAVLDKASCFEIQSFMESEPGRYMYSVLEERGNFHSLNKFLSYNPTHRGVDNPSVDHMEEDLSTLPEAKRSRMDYN